jgi:hypothetical protein
MKTRGKKGIGRPWVFDEGPILGYETIFMAASGWGSAPPAQPASRIPRRRWRSYRAHGSRHYWTPDFPAFALIRFNAFPYAFFPVHGLANPAESNRE